MFNKLSNQNLTSHTVGGSHFLEVESESVPDQDLLIESYDGFSLRINNSSGALLAAQFVAALRAATDPRFYEAAEATFEKGVLA